MAAASTGWVSSAQSIFGAQVTQIADQLAGVPLSPDRNWHTQLGSMWTFPANSEDTTGLGGGVTYAFDPELCPKLMPLFKEDIAGASFITCDDAKSAVFRALNSWGTNSRFFKFTDVTGECENAGWPTSFNQVEQPHGGCALAEIWITAITGEETERRQLQEVARRRRLSEELGAEEELSEQLAVVEGSSQALDSGGTYVATALSHWRPSYEFRYTNGDTAFQWVLTGGEWTKQPRPILETYAGTFAFGVDADKLCWYLDSQFCSSFHELKRKMGSPGSAKTLMQAVFLIVSLGTLIFSCGARYQFWRALFGCGVSSKTFKREKAARDNMNSEQAEDEMIDKILEKDTVWDRLKEAFEEAAEWNPLIVSIQVMLILSPPVLLGQIIMPCWDCYDFEAATLHELGHFLGLGHPDNIPDNMRTDLPWVNTQGVAENVYQADLAAGLRMNESTCHSMWDRVYSGVPPDAVVQQGRAGYPLRNAIMEAFTQHNPMPCLTRDDVEGVATLYPDCSDHGISEVVCHKVRHNIGTVRIAVYVLVPMLITLVVMMCCAGYFHSYHEEEAEEAIVGLAVAKKENKKLRAQLKKLGGRAGPSSPGSHDPHGRSHAGYYGRGPGHLVAPSEFPHPNEMNQSL